MFYSHQYRPKSVITFSLILLLSLMITNYSFSALVGYWSFDQGDSGKDLSGNNNHGKIQGKPKSVVGKIKTALELNGSSDWVSIEHNASIANFDQLSISAWIKLIKVNAWTAVIEKGIHEKYLKKAISWLVVSVTTRSNQPNGITLPEPMMVSWQSFG